MVESIRRIFFGSWLFWPRKDYFFSTQSRPPCQGLVGNLLWEKGWRITLSVLSRTHLEFFPRFHKGTILSNGELWGQVHPMDYAAAAKKSRCAWADESVPYPVHQVGYQRFKKHLVLKYHSCLHRYIQEEMEFLDISLLSTAYRYAAKIEQK